MPKLSRKDVSPGSFPRFGRMDSYSRLGVSAISLALKDAGLDEWTDPREIAIIASTVYGCLKTDEDYCDTVIPEGGRLASPHLFVYALTSTFLGEAAIHFGLSGPSFALSESVLSGLPGVSMAMRGIGKGEYDSALAGVCDAGAPPALAGIGRSVPGALFFVLQNENSSRRPSYGTLTQNGSGTLFYDGKEVEDLNTLASICTASIT